MIKKRLVAIFIAIVCVCSSVVALAACGQDNAEPVTVEISQTTAAIDVGATVRLTAKASDGSQITWTSSAESVATVSNGTVKGVGEGKATITAASGDVKQTCEVTVTNVTVTISKTELALDKEGEPQTLTATASDSSEIEWTSSDPSVAKVENGVVTPVGEGTAVITAKKKGGVASATCNVTVTWQNKPEGYYEIGFGEAATSAQDPGKWYYWNAQDLGWGAGCVVEVSEAYFGDGVATITFSGNDSTTQNWGFQLYYTGEGLEVGKEYQVTVTITSSVSGTFNLFEQYPVELEAGVPKTVTFTSVNGSVYPGNGEGPSFVLHAGISTGEGAATCVEAATITVTVPVFEPVSE